VEHDNSFRTRQAVSDLAHHIKPLLAPHLAEVAAAAGLSLAETGAAFGMLRDDGFRFVRDQTLPLLDGLETIATDTLRAAVANGLRRAGQSGVLALDRPPCDADCLTRTAEVIAEPLLRIARSMNPNDLLAVAQADRGQDVARHLSALRDMIKNRDGILGPDESWVPSEVIELTASAALRPGFEGCTAILLLNVLKNGDGMGWIRSRWPQLGAACCALRPSTRDPVLAGIRYVYESDPDFAGLLPGKPVHQPGFSGLIPVVQDAL